MLRVTFIVFGFALCHFANGATDTLGVDSLESDTSGPVAITKLGSIRGLRAEDGNYVMFMGIPYAKVDKNNIFGPAIPNPKFESIFNAYDDSARCPQIEEFNDTIVGSLDCMHLNIYVPSCASLENPLPVFVWIYGGGFKIGFAGRFLFGPKFIVKHDVIVVTFNYRIGPYGFMCLDIPEISGNQGLKDQILAMRWIKENINAFGGDDSRITIAGNSIGSTSVDIHLHYLKEKLFHKAILHSVYPPLEDAMNIERITHNQPITLARHLNYNATDVRDALSFLSTVDTHKVVAAAADAGLRFGACIEKFNNSDNFIKEFPINVDKKRIKEIEVMIGFNGNELYVLKPLLQLKVNYLSFNRTKSLLQSDFDVGGDVELLDEMTKVVNRFYFGDKPVENQTQTVIDLLSDFNINFKTLQIVQNYMENGVKLLYLYLFSYSGGRNFVKHRENITGGGAVHADELGYLFDISYMEKPLEPADQLIVDRMTELWTNFIKNGNPTPEPTELVPVLWPQVTRDKYYYLELDSEIRVGSRPFMDRMAFLEMFYLKYGKYLRHKQQNLMNEEDFNNICLSAGKKVVLNLYLMIFLLLCT